MRYFFVVDGSNTTFIVKPYVKEEDAVVYRSMKKSAWKKIAKLGTFYEKSGKIKFSGVRIDELVNYLNNKFGNCDIAVEG